MSLTKDERDALERLVMFHDEYDYVYWDGNMSPFDPGEDGVTCARALLREHPADEETPLEKSWLLKVGGKQYDNPLKVTFEREDALPIGLWDVDDGWKVMLIIAPHAAMQIVRGLKTRGQLRRLASVLGIDLKGGGK